MKLTTPDDTIRFLTFNSSAVCSISVSEELRIIDSDKDDAECSWPGHFIPQKQEVTYWTPGDVFGWEKPNAFTDETCAHRNWEASLYRWIPGKMEADPMTGHFVTANPRRTAI
jgi:hypothetical protein